MNIVANAGNSGVSFVFGAFVQDAESATMIEQAAEQYQFNTYSIQLAGLDQATAMLEIVDTPDILLVDIDDCESVPDGLARLAEVCDSGTTVIIVGSVNDLRLYQALKEEGVDEYLLKPLTVDALTRAFEQVTRLPDIQSPAADQQAVTDSDVVAVIGTRGGVGATMVSTSLAWHMAEKEGKRVALVDLDPLFGGVCLTLDLEPGHGLAEALSDPDRIDGLFLERAMIRHGDNLAVLAGENVLHDAPGLDFHAVSHLIDELRASFDLILIDFPRAALGQLPQAGSLFDKAILVSDLSLHALRDSMRISGHFAADIEKDALFFVGNAPRGDTKPETAKAEFEKAAEITLTTLMPHDHKGGLEAAQHGKALAEMAGPAWQQALKPLTTAIGGAAAEEKSALKKLMTLSFSF